MKYPQHYWGVGGPCSLVPAERGAGQLEEDIRIILDSHELQSADTERGDRNVRGGVRRLAVRDLSGDQELARLVAVDGVRRIGPQSGRDAGLRQLRLDVVGEQAVDARQRVRQEVIVAVGVRAIADDQLEVRVRIGGIAVGGDLVAREPGRVLAESRVESARRIRDRTLQENKMGCCLMSSPGHHPLTRL